MTKSYKHAGPPTLGHELNLRSGIPTFEGMAEMVEQGIG